MSIFHHRYLLKYQLVISHVALSTLEIYVFMSQKSPQHFESGETLLTNFPFCAKGWTIDLGLQDVIYAGTYYLWWRNKPIQHSSNTILLWYKI